MLRDAPERTGAVDLAIEAVSAALTAAKFSPTSSQRPSPCSGERFHGSVQGADVGVGDAKRIPRRLQCGTDGIAATVGPGCAVE
jgi:hypothetical protein